ncbi:MAG: hypothetical protein ACXVFU_12990 [Nocardioidaceae bacterium]
MSHRHRAARSIHGYWLRHRASADFRRAVTASALVAVLAVAAGVLVTRSGPDAHRTVDAAAPPAEHRHLPAMTPTVASTATLAAVPEGPTAAPTTRSSRPSREATSPVAPGGPLPLLPTGSLPGIPGSGGPTSSPRVSTGTTPAAPAGGLGAGGNPTTAPQPSAPRPARAPVPTQLASHQPTTAPQPRPQPQPSPRPSPSPRPQPSSRPSPSPRPQPSPRPSPSPSPAPDLVAPVTSARTVSAVHGVWTIALGADEPASFTCSLDGGPFVPCSAITTYANLHPGPHTVAARATDRAGNTDPTPAVVRITMTGAGTGHHRAHK